MAIDQRKFFYPHANRGDRMVRKQLVLMPVVFLAAATIGLMAGNEVVWWALWFLCVGFLIRSVRISLRGMRRSVVIREWEIREGIRPVWTYGFGGNRNFWRLMRWSKYYR